MVIWTTRWLRKGQAMALYSKQIHWHKWIYWAYSMSEIIICIQTSLRVGASRLTCILPKFELFPARTWGLRTWRRVSSWKIWWGLKMWSLKSYVKSKRFHLEWLNKSLSNREAMKAKGWLYFWFSFLFPGQDQNQTSLVLAIPHQAGKSWAPNFNFPEYVPTTLLGDQVTRLRSEILKLLGT